MFQSSSTTSLRGWSNLKPELRRFFRVAKPYGSAVLKKHQEKIAAATGKNVVDSSLTNKMDEKTSTAPSMPSQPNKSSDSDGTTPKRNALSTSVEMNDSSSRINSLSTLDRQPSKPGQSSAKKTRTLQDMFKKQQEAGTPHKHSVSSSSRLPKKTKNSLKNMFEKQIAAASSSPSPNQETTEAEQVEAAGKQVAAAAARPLPNGNTLEAEQVEASASAILSPDGDTDKAMQVETAEPALGSNSSSARSNTKPNALEQVAPPMNSFSFKRSPFADEMTDEMMTPAIQVVASASNLASSQSKTVPVASQRQPLDSIEENDALLCVVCEDGRKEVLLMPCNHMCLCKNCAESYLFKTMKDCPICRTPVKEFRAVFY